jgi:hypothetical protein
VSVLRITFNLGYNSGTFDMSTASHKSCCVNFLESYLIPIIACLFVSALGLWWRRAAGFFVSLFALSFAGVVYIQWYQATFNIMQDNGIQAFSQMPFQQQQLLTLNDATWWDLAVLSVIAITALWQLKVLMFAVRSPSSSPYS